MMLGSIPNYSHWADNSYPPLPLVVVVVVNNNNNNNNLKCKYPIIEIQCMWYVKAKVITLIIGATGKSHSHVIWAIYWENTKSRNNKQEPHGHCTHIEDSTNWKVQNIFHVWNNITCSTNYKYRTAATLYTLETWFVSGT
jgi:hypothetical protein